jgi:hypothetical protein
MAKVFVVEAIVPGRGCIVTQSGYSTKTRRSIGQTEQHKVADALNQDNLSVLSTASRVLKLILGRITCKLH